MNGWLLRNHICLINGLAQIKEACCWITFQPLNPFCSCRVAGSPSPCITEHVWRCQSVPSFKDRTSIRGSISELRIRDDDWPHQDHQLMRCRCIELYCGSIRLPSGIHKDEKSRPKEAECPRWTHCSDPLLRAINLNVCSCASCRLELAGHSQHRCLIFYSPQKKSPLPSFYLVAVHRVRSWPRSANEPELGPQSLGATRDSHNTHVLASPLFLASVSPNDLLCVM